MTVAVAASTPEAFAAKGADGAAAASVASPSKTKMKKSASSTADADKALCDGGGAAIDTEAAGNGDAAKPDGTAKGDDDDDAKDKLTPLERCEKRIRAAKRSTRSELSVSGGEWQKNHYAENPAILSTAGLGDDLARISVKTTTLAEFIERFERPRIPCIITDAMEGWGANHEWTYDKLKERFATHKFKVGSDDDGYAARLKFAHIHHYVTDPEHMKDDSPLYIFDGSFGDKEGSQPLLKDYGVPEFFNEDLFQHVGEKRRPPYRWVVMGPPRSGSSVHIDPLSTAAWNALVSGHKRWCLFPPTEGLTKQLLKPKGIGLDGEAVTWFHRMYPRTRSVDWPWPKPLDTVQGPGEIMYVPDGWWHAVLNLDHTVAVTQNYVSSTHFDKVWRVTKRGRPKMSAKWLEKLRAKRPDLAARADAQPWRSAASEHEQTSSSSSSSSSSGSSDTSEDDDDADKGAKDKAKVGDGGAEGGEERVIGAVNEEAAAAAAGSSPDKKKKAALADDATLEEMAKERKERKEESKRRKSRKRSRGEGGGGSAGGSGSAEGGDVETTEAAAPGDNSGGSGDVSVGGGEVEQTKEFTKFLEGQGIEVPEMVTK